MINKDKGRKWPKVINSKPEETRAANLEADVPTQIFYNPLDGASYLHLQTSWSSFCSINLSFRFPPKCFPSTSLPFCHQRHLLCHHKVHCTAMVTMTMIPKQSELEEAKVEARWRFYSWSPSSSAAGSVSLPDSSLQGGCNNNDERMVSTVMLSLSRDNNYLPCKVLYILSGCPTNLKEVLY